MSISRKNLILYLNHVVQMVYKGKINVQTAMSEIMMLPSKLNCAFLLLSIHNTEDSSDLIYGRERFINKYQDRFVHPKNMDQKEQAKEYLENVSQNLDPFVCGDGHKVSKFEFKSFAWDLCLDINNPAQDDYDLQASNRKVYLGGMQYPNDDIPKKYNCAESDETWLKNLSKARKNQDKCWGRINHLKHRI